MNNNVQNSKSSFKSKIFDLMQEQSVSKVIKMGSKIKKISPLKYKVIHDTLSDRKFINHSFSQDKKVQIIISKKNRSLNKNKILGKSTKYDIQKSQSFKHISSTIQNNKTIQRQSQNKNYLLQTLKKMENVRRDLSKTFENYDTTFIKKGYQNSKSRYKKNSKNKIQSLKLQKSANFSSNKKLKTSFSKDKVLKQTSSKKYLTSINKNNQQKKNNELFTSIKILRKHLRQPNKFTAILKNQFLIVYYRVVGKSLIQLQIHILKAIEQLWLKLSKGNLQCQTLNQQYKNLRKKQIITLLSSVRSINLQQNLFNMPKIQIQIQSQNKEKKTVFSKLKTFQDGEKLEITNFSQAVIPFSWIMLTQTHNNKQSSSNHNQASRVKNKAILQNIQLQQSWSQYLSVLQLKNSKNNKSQFYSRFLFQNKPYRIQIDVKSIKHADLSLQGKGQQDMQKLVTFIQSLIKINKSK